MKRGFLNKSNAKKSSTKQPKSKRAPAQPDKHDAEKKMSPKFPSDDSDNQTILDLHSAPKSLVAQTGKKRFIFRAWPRNPEGPVIRETPKGKQASNGLQLWGATLYDFFQVQRIPNNPCGRTLSTGSKLAAHMRNIGELEWADDEIYWADQEEDPVEVPPCDIGKLIKDLELRINMGLDGESMKRTGVQQAQHSTSAAKTKQSSMTLFDPCNYPPPWPLIPFSALTHNLQKRLPLHLLPQKLIVHDPWNLLCVQNSWGFGQGDKYVDWTAKDDVIRTYNLKLSKAGTEKLEKEKKSLAKPDGTTTDTSQRERFLHMPDRETPGPVEPAIMVFPPPRPPPTESVPEAHLYLSPAHKSGYGNHSVVYKAELEIPRSILVEDVLCQKCMMDKVAEQVEEKKRRGEYPYARKEGHENAESLGESSRSAGTPDSKSANVTSSGNGSPFKLAEFKRTIAPLVDIYPEVEWQNPARGPYCPHLQQSSRCKRGPVTAKVSVAAKLSIQYDEHLEREANNYQSFPSHLFEHWSGYNVIPPLHDPVPAGAVVPQFYGYYVPEKSTNANTSQYLSPILLIENCGIPIEPECLNIDDRQECSALLYRFHEAGWNHGSFAPRNILMQPGPLSAWPPFRDMNDTLSFRLIDFGRSLGCTSETRATEEMIVYKALDLEL